MLMVMPVQALIRTRIPASRQLPKVRAFVDFTCAANLGGAEPLKRNNNCSGAGAPYHQKGRNITAELLNIVGLSLERPDLLKSLAEQ